MLFFKIFSLLFFVTLYVSIKISYSFIQIIYFLPKITVYDLIKSNDYLKCFCLSIVCHCSSDLSTNLLGYSPNYRS